MRPHTFLLRLSDTYKPGAAFTSIKMPLMPRAAILFSHLGFAETWSRGKKDRGGQVLRIAPCCQTATSGEADVQAPAAPGGGERLLRDTQSVPGNLGFKLRLILSMSPSWDTTTAHQGSDCTTENLFRMFPL